MVAFTLHGSRHGKSDLNGFAIPLIFLEDLRKYWQPRPHGAIWEVILPTPREPEWVALGEFLLEGIRGCGTAVGLTFNADSSLPGETVFKWFHSVVSTEADVGLVNVRLDALFYPIKKTVIGTEVTWNSVQPTTTALWMRSLWRDVESHVFDQGCDLLVASFEADTLADLRETDSFTTSVFGRTLSQATAWMVPIYDNIGFVVGLPSDSELYRSLVAQALPNL